MTNPKDRERPSTHGALVGQAIASMASAGRRVDPAIPEECATCAFRAGTMTNQMASTVLDALQCAIGADPAVFACHHGMNGCEPTRVCAGWLAAQKAPYAEVRQIAELLHHALDARVAGGPDPIRDAFDAWLSTVDPHGVMNDHQRARIYARKAVRNP